MLNLKRLYLCVVASLIAAIGDVSHPTWRGSAVGIYRFWRDMGYVVGALGAGAIADLAGIETAIVVVGVLTIGSGILVAGRMPETHARPR